MHSYNPAYSGRCLQLLIPVLLLSTPSDPSLLFLRLRCSTLERSFNSSMFAGSQSQSGSSEHLDCSSFPVLRSVDRDLRISLSSLLLHVAQDQAHDTIPLGLTLASLSTVQPFVHLSCPLSYITASWSRKARALVPRSHKDLKGVLTVYVLSATAIFLTYSTLPFSLLPNFVVVTWPWLSHLFDDGASLVNPSFLLSHSRIILARDDTFRCSYFDVATAGAATAARALFFAIDGHSCIHKARATQQCSHSLLCRPS